MNESIPPVHEDEVEHHADLVRRLVESQFPQWAGLEVKPSPNQGTSNALYRLGEQRVVRLPRVDYAVASITREATWLPRLGPQLPVEVPELVGLGRPEFGFASPWAVYRWIEGEPLGETDSDDPHERAITLANFLNALHRIDPTGGPDSSRGVPLRERDAATREAIDALHDQYDPGVLTAVWDRALGARDWNRAPVWLHGDLLPSNLLVHRGRLHAVIDFGGVGIGDPASDLVCAWASLPSDARPTFRSALRVDDDTWERARGWALSIALIIIPYYRETHVTHYASAATMVDAALAERGE